MNRKQFLTSILPATLTVNAIGQTGKPKKKLSKTSLALVKNSHVHLIPPYLKTGDIIGITSPAGHVTLEEINPAIEQIKSWGFEIKTGIAIGKKDFTFGGTDEERLQDFQAMIDDDSVKAILCARGGYGLVRIIDQINFTNLKKHPKWIIGFSDVTVLHSHIHQQCKVATIHSKMCNSFPDDWSLATDEQKLTILSIKDALAGEKMEYRVPASANNINGKAKGTLIGGNLKTLESLAGSASDINTDNKILFVEDTGEYLYSIDRMFWNLKRSGKLKALAGLIIGGFKIKDDTAGEPFGKTLCDIVKEKIKDCNYPVCFDFPVGHQRNNYALKCGVLHELNVTADECVLSETRL